MKHGGLNGGCKHGGLNGGRKHGGLNGSRKLDHSNKMPALQANFKKIDQLTMPSVNFHTTVQPIRSHARAINRMNYLRERQCVRHIKVQETKGSFVCTCYFHLI